MSKINCVSCGKELVTFNPLDDYGVTPERSGNWIAANCTLCDKVTTLNEYITYRGKG